jgi:molybdopterin synthase sulfur carrier subunit
VKVLIPAVKVLIPSALHSYTGKAWVEASGRTLGTLLDDLDRRYPGIRFRMVDEQDAIRRHIRIFVEGEQVFELARALDDVGEVVIVQALTGG